MEYDEIDELRQHHAGWRLLRADNAALVLSFLGRVFVQENARSVASPELVARLDDELYVLNERLGEGTFPRSARAYLDDWASPASGWLRKYYPPGSDEPHFDATPAVEKALGWLRSIRERAFVGTESRLNTIFELLRQMAFGSEEDPEARLAELRARRLELDRQIAEVESGNVVVMEAAAVRDRYQQFATTARELLADFREVDANFRRLDRDLREQIAGWDGSKGELLDVVVGDRNAIADSDQGKSFQAFYDFLLSPRRQEEFTALLDRVLDLGDIPERDEQMRHIHYDWLDAGEQTQATVRQLSDQLRRFLDDQAWLENRRVMDLVRSIEANAVAVRSAGTPDLSVEIDATAPVVSLPFERPLYSPPTRTSIDSRVQNAVEEVDPSALFEQVYVDRVRLSSTVRRALRHGRQVGLAEVVRDHPLEAGLAELVTYFSLSDGSFDVVFDDQAREFIEWYDADHVPRLARLPRVTFVPTTGA